MHAPKSRGLCVRVASVQHALDQQSARLISAHDSIEHVSVQHASVQHASVQHNPRSITRLGSAHPSRFIARTVQHTPWFSTPRFSARLGSARLSSARLAPARLAPSRISTPRTTSLWLVGRIALRPATMRSRTTESEIQLLGGVCSTFVSLAHYDVETSRFRIDCSTEKKSRSPDLPFRSTLAVYAVCI